MSNNTPNRLRNQAGLNGNQISTIPVGGEFFVLDGPVCNDGYAWYQVQYGNYAGWTAESGGGRYWLEPLFTNTILPNEVHEDTSPNGVLAVGIQAIVFTLDDGLKLRSAPGIDNRIIETMRPGMIVTLLEYPVFVDGYNWWLIRSSSGNEGWAVEAADGLVTLIPVLEEDVTIPILAFPPVNSQEAVRIYTSIWSLTEFRDIRIPSEVNYRITVDRDRQYRLAFLWCADTSGRLREIVEPLSVEFQIDGITITNTHVLRSNLDGVCEIWETILADWTRGEEYLISIRYCLDEPIFDGTANYEAGEYAHLIAVAVR